MAKVAFSKLNKKNDVEPKTFSFGDNVIEVKQYLPVVDKLNMIKTICVNAVEVDTKFFNPLVIEVEIALNILYNYTNISFTEKQKEDIFKLYDIVSQNGLLNEVYANIPEDEMNFIVDIIDETIESNERYNFSLVGVLEGLTKSYGEMDLDASKIRDKLANAEGLELLKDIMPLINLG